MLFCQVHRSGDLGRPSECPESIGMYIILVQTSHICITTFGEEQSCMSLLRTQL